MNPETNSEQIWRQKKGYGTEIQFPEYVDSIERSFSPGSISGQYEMFLGGNRREESNKRKPDIINSHLIGEG